MDAPTLIVEQSSDRATVYRTHGGGIVTVPKAPEVGGDIHHAAGIVSRAMDAFAELDQARRRIDEDRSLSEHGKAEKLQPLQEQVERQVGEALQALEDYGAHVAAFEARTYAPPPIERGDAATALEDIEIRDYLRSVAGDPEGKLYQEIATNPRLMAAVKRSPVPMGAISKIVDQTWAAHVEVTSPQAAQVRNVKAAHAWAASILPQLQRLVR